MDMTRAPLAPPASAAPRPLPQGMMPALSAGLGLNLLLGVGLFGQTLMAAVAGLAYLGAAWLVTASMRRHYPHDRLGACNVVTLMRLALTTALLVPLLAGHGTGWTIAAIATLSLSLDGVDGYLARRSGLCSDFGARFDMEVDALLALILSLHALSGSPVGAEVLVLGVLRYVFAGAGLVLPWLNAPLPVSYARKTVCVLQLAVLIALQVPAIPPDAAIILTRAVSVALIWSFARDVLWLRSHR